MDIVKTSLSLLKVLGGDLFFSYLVIGKSRKTIPVLFTMVFIKKDSLYLDFVILNNYYYIL